MIGQLDPTQRQATVIGAGVAGLLMADRLDRLGYEVTLYEAGSRAGGLISTRKTPQGIAENAAHSILATPAVRKLFKELGVELAELRRDSKARFILRRNSFRRFPLGIFEAISAFFRAYFVLADRSLDPRRLTMEQWGQRHLGRRAVEFLFNPFLRGIYAARPSELCVGAAFPALVVPHGHSLFSAQIARKFTRRRKFALESPPSSGPGRMMAPRLGMEALVSALESRLRTRLGVRFRLGARLTELPPSPNLVICVPASEAGQLLLSQDPALAHALSRVIYAPLVTATAFVRTADLGSSRRGVGVLVPESEGRDCLGILFNSSAFDGRVKEPSAYSSFTVMLGGTSASHWVKATDNEIRGAVARELRELLDLRASPVAVEIQRWERAIPQYNVALLDGWSQAQRTWCAKPGRILFGNYTGQVSLRGMIERVSRLDG